MFPEGFTHTILKKAELSFQPQPELYKRESAFIFKNSGLKLPSEKKFIQDDLFRGFIPEKYIPK
jgi:hypothetical protein